MHCLRKAVQKKRTFLADMSAKALSPPPLCVNRNMRKKQVFFSYIKYIFLKLESPETDDFALKKISGCEVKLVSRNFNISRNANFFTNDMRQPYKNILKMSLHIIAFQNILAFSKKCSMIWYILCTSIYIVYTYSLLNINFKVQLKY